MYTYLKTGELLKCRKCGTEGDVWFNGRTVGCSKCGKVITRNAEAMCVEQERYADACRYSRDQVKQARSSDGIPIPESVKEFREKLLGSWDREAYPLYFKLRDPNWPFHYLAAHP